MTPLIIYGLERGTGFWPASDPGVYRDFHQWIRGGWVLMELGTVLTALIALAFVRFPFVTAPIAFALWYMSMDLTRSSWAIQYSPGRLGCGFRCVLGW
ncbi:MAG TPA: hypothetical protein VG206_19045 [Terriglobia bacterium]|nr:hypothetical protein [Terriglobia bacterium]